ncbi:tetratricopeptide repeat protein [Dactylosporangium sp. NBC_01737]|uniref:ATP-binding protein n=1 Tax=Dactylosporangium sp. NBC_01737 TaxID=2975959 RepID=UPI002E10E35D|nr:tetratricopeptide repeat protein [Dactylosporangium sp. NBC_01737]
MTPRAQRQPHDSLVTRTAGVQTLTDLAGLLRALRRRHARERQASPLTYRELAGRTGWSQTAIAEYLTGRTLPPTDRFDALAALLGATAAELGALATARDRVEDQRHRPDSAGPAPVVPRQLPASPHHFVGRSRELAMLTDWSQRPSAGGPVVVAAAGTAGVGKTTLVVFWAHQVSGRFPDGQLFLNLRGFEPSGGALDPADALRQLLDALHVPPERIPAGVAARSALLRSLLADRRMLVVIDNARDSAQVRPLLPAAPGCLVVVTSRNQLAGLVATDGARPLRLDLPTRDEARDLLAGRLGADRTDAEPDAVDEIVTRCARLPLALAVVAARGGVNPHFSLRDLAAELHGAHDRLDALATDDAGSVVRTVFSWSYQGLTPSAAAMFRLLGLHPGPELSLVAAAALAGLAPAQARAVLAELTRANLAAEPVPGRFAVHDLLHAYAAEMAHEVDSPADRWAATDRMIEHYLHTARDADRLLLPHREPSIALEPLTDGGATCPLADRDEAMDWLTTEHHTLVALTRLAATGREPLAIRLAWVLCTYFQWRGHWHDQVTTQHLALQAAQRLGESSGQAHAHHHLGRAHAKLSQQDDALIHYAQALRLFARDGDHDGQAQTHLGLGAVFEHRGQHRTALRHARHALELFRLARNLPGQANAMNSAGWCHVQLGEHAPAITACRQALVIQQRIGDRDGEAATWDSLGYAEHHLGRFAEAVSCYRRAVELRRELGDRFYEAATLDRLGDTQLASGDPAAAAEAWRDAQSILRDLGHADADRINDKLAGTGPHG